MPQRRRAPKGQGNLRQRPNGRYELTIDLGLKPDGTRHRVSVSGATAEEAVARANEKRAAATDPHAHGTIGDMLDAHAARLDARLAAGHITPGTRDDWKYATQRCRSVEHTPLATLTPAWIDGWTAELGGAPSTRRKTYQLLHAACDTARRNGMVPPTWDPFNGVEAPSEATTEARHATKADIQALLAASERPWHTLWVVLAYTGMRPGEGRTMHWEHVDLALATVSVTKNRSKNTSSTRSVALLPVVVDELAAWKAESGNPTTGPVFPNRNGQPVDRWRVGEAFERAAPKGLTPHSLRHGVATRLLQARIPVHEVANILGNSPEVTLRTYAHVIKKARADALGTLLADS